jgi:hypothetical protein
VDPLDNKGVRDQLFDWNIGLDEFQRVNGFPVVWWEVLTTGVNPAGGSLGIPFIVPSMQFSETFYGNLPAEVRTNYLPVKREFARGWNYFTPSTDASNTVYFNEVVTGLSAYLTSPKGKTLSYNQAHELGYEDNNNGFALYNWHGGGLDTQLAEMLLTPEHANWMAYSPSISEIGTMMGLHTHGMVSKLPSSASGLFPNNLGSEANPYHHHLVIHQSGQTMLLTHSCAPKTDGALALLGPVPDLSNFKFDGASFVQEYGAYAEHYDWQAVTGDRRVVFTGATQSSTDWSWHVGIPGLGLETPMLFTSQERGGAMDVVLSPPIGFTDGLIFSELNSFYADPLLPEFFSGPGAQVLNACGWLVTVKDNPRRGLIHGYTRHDGPQ